MSLQLIDEGSVSPTNADKENGGIVICIDDDNDDGNKISNDNGEAEEKDKTFYQREEQT